MLIISDGNPRGLGYLEVDQRASGVPVSMGMGSHFEADTYTCTHCEAVVVMNPMRKRERYKCVSCNHHICDPCAAKKAAGEPCVTYRQKVEQYLEQVTRQPESSSGIILP